MANYKIPRSIEFIEAMPMNASGKILKTELRLR
jgi:acyl-CoA synthetase (AMP-forming)/AMP-acid ligase II